MRLESRRPSEQPARTRINLEGWLAGFGGAREIPSKRFFSGGRATSDGVELQSECINQVSRANSIRRYGNKATENLVAAAVVVVLLERRGKQNKTQVWGNAMDRDWDFGN